MYCKRAVRILAAVAMAAFFHNSLAIAGTEPDAFARAVELAQAGDPEAAYLIIKPLAEAGNPQAQYYLGKMLSAGQGVATDKAAAFEWYLRAAEQDHREAQFMLGAAYGAGFGVKQNKLNALQWFIIAGTEDGLAFDMLTKEMGPRAIEQARAMAREWRAGRDRSRVRMALQADAATKVAMLTELADAGIAAAQYELGNLFLIGLPSAQISTKQSSVPGLLGLQPDHETAKRLFLLAAQQGYAPAQRAYADRLGDDDPVAVEWYRKAAEQGDADARYSLARRYASGSGVHLDANEAIRLYREAAGTEHTYAMIALGQVYFDGTAIPQDLERAYTWLLLARAYAKYEFNIVAVEDVDRMLDSVGRLLPTRKMDSAKETAAICSRTKFRNCDA